MFEYVYLYDIVIWIYYVTIRVCLVDTEQQRNLNFLVNVKMNCVYKLAINIGISNFKGSSFLQLVGI